MPFVETFAKLDGEPSAPAAGKGFIQTTAPLDDAGPGLMDRIGGYLKNAANNVAPTEPDPTADMIMPAPTKSLLERTVEDAPAYNEKLLNDQSRRANWEQSQPKPAVSSITPLPDIAPTLRDRLQDSFASVVGGPDAAEMHRTHRAAEATAMLVGRNGDSNLSNDDAWQQARQGIGGISQVPQIMAERFAKAISFGFAAPNDPAQSHSWQESVGGAGAELAAFYMSPGKAAASLMPKKLSQFLAPAAGDGFRSLLAKDVLMQSATMSMATGLQNIGTAILDTHSLKEAAEMMGHSVESGAVTGATFGAAGRLLPDKTMTQWALRALGVSVGQDAISGANPMDSRPLEDKLFSYATNVFFTRHGAGPRPIDPRAAPAAPPSTLDAAPVHAPDIISKAANVADAISAATASVPNIDPATIQRNHATSLDTTTGIAGEMNRIRALRKVAEPVAEPAVEPVAERLAPEDKPVGPDLSTPADVHNVEMLPEHSGDSRPDWEATVNENGMAVRQADHAANDAIVREFNEKQSGSNSLGESNALNGAVPIKVSNAADTPQVAIARGIADKLGIKLVVVEGEGSATPFNGVNFTTKDGQRTILVSKDSPINGLTGAGHEIGHDFQKQFPELYGSAQPDGTYSGLLGVLHPLIGDARIAERQALYERAGQKISHEQALGEMTNDMMGNRIIEPSFWNYVAQKNVGVFQKLAAVVKATLARITDGGAAYGEAGKSKPFGLTLKQLKEVNRHIDQAMSKYLDDATQAKVNLDAEHMATKPIAEKAATAPVESAPGDQHQAGGMRTHEVPVHMIKQSKDVPQFKSDAAENGVVEALGGKFDRTGVAPIQLWKRLNGDLEVISGRHRLDLAQRSGEKTIPAQVHHEADGFTAQHAGAMDSVLNIRDGQGKVKDYVNYFRHTSLSRSDAEQHGLLARSLGKRAFAIATEGSDGLIAAHRDGRVSDEAAVAIAAAAPGDERLQAVGLQALQDGKSIGQAANLVRAVKLLSGPKDSTGDMFGFDDSGMREAEAMARVATKTQRDLQERLSAISGAAKRPELAKKEGIKVGDAPALLKRIEEIKAEKAAWDNWTTNPELVEKIRAELHPGKPEGLDSYSPADVLAKEARDAQGQRSDAKESSDQQNRLKADAEAGEFALTGSDRAADVDSNQGSMFSAKEGKPDKPARTVRTEALIELRKRNSILESLKTCLGA